MKDDYDLKENISNLIDSYDIEREISLYQEIGLITGVMELLTDLKDNKIITAIATSASKRRMNAVLDFFHIRELFNEYVCDEDVKASKPSPEIYVTCANKLQVKPSECVVIEDSHNGMLAAKEAGMGVIGYKGLTLITEDLRECDAVIYDFNELKTNKIYDLFG